MKSKFFSASVLALAALGAVASASALAEGSDALFADNFGLNGQTAVTSTITRAQIRAEVASAQLATRYMDYERQYPLDNAPVATRNTAQKFAAKQ